MFKFGKNRTSPPKLRVNLFLLLILAGATLIGYRLFSISFLEHALYSKSAKAQQQTNSAYLTGRGNIYFSDYSVDQNKLIASNKRSYYIFALRNNINIDQEPAKKIGKIVGDPREISSRFEQKLSNYFVIAEGLSKTEADSVLALRLDGISIAEEVERIYSKGGVASHVTGFVGFDGYDRVGQYGVEAYYDNVLSGINSALHPSGNFTYGTMAHITNWLKKREPVEIKGEENYGDDLILTVDYNIQLYVEELLASLVNKWSASGGTIIVQEPETGAILAMASSPSFDPNKYSKYNYDIFANPAIQNIFEPGSSFKGVTMAAAIDSGSVTPETTYYDSGKVTVANREIKNALVKERGRVSMKDVLRYSLNTGSIFAQQRMGNDVFIKYVVSFGFGQKAEIDLAGELAGNIGNLYENRDIYFATASFGQGVAVTPIQLINAYSAIANGGRLMKPFVVKSTIRVDGSESYFEPYIVDVPINEKTSRVLTQMLVEAVDKGIEKAAVTGYKVAAKTGTAQIPDDKGGYRENDVIHNIVGFVPASEPKATIFIKLDKPRGIEYSADSLAEPFSDLARFILRYFKITPDRP